MSSNTETQGAVANRWITEQFGIVLTDQGSPVGLTMDDLIAVALRRNPLRAQLLVSTVLGKHLAVDPRVVAGTGRLLGALVARALDGADGPAPADWTTAARRAVGGAEPAVLLDAMDAARMEAATTPPTTGVLTLGFAETATALGHLVADQLKSGYLHSTRSRDGSAAVAAEFTEAHSHATGHLLRPDPPGLLVGSGPVVLVDDELSTGRTALNVIEAMQKIAPRDHYVLAGLVDVRAPADDRHRIAVAERVGARIDVVNLLRGGISVPHGTIERVARQLDRAPAGSGSGTGNRDRPTVPRSIAAPWPAGLPQGGRHGFTDADRPAFDSAVATAGATLAAECGSAQRVLVVGTEEFMYLPLRIALELAADPAREVRFQSTTRSPVHAMNRPGYPISRRIDFRSATLDDGTSGERHLYNACWAPRPGEISGQEADLILVVDDGQAAAGSTGVGAAIAAATGAPVLLAVLTSDCRQ